MPHRSLRQLEHLLNVPRNAQYGRSSEKLDDDQRRFALEDAEQAVAALEAEEDKGNPEKQRERAAAKREDLGLLPSSLLLDMWRGAFRVCER